MFSFAALLFAAASVAPIPHSPDLYVSSFFGSAIDRFFGPLATNSGPDPLSSKPAALYAFPVARRPWGLAFGPDGNLYVANFGTGSEAIVRVQGPFSLTPGTVSTFVDGGAFFDVAFGPDGQLYAAGHGPILRYDIVDGTLLGAFTQGHQLAEVHAIAFGDDGYLYVANYDSCNMNALGCTTPKSEIVRFDAKSGQFVDVYLTSGSSGLTLPWDLAFGPEGALFIANGTLDGNGSILRFERPCGRVRSVRGEVMHAPFVTRAGLNPLAIAFGPDQNLYVSSGDNSGSSGGILRFDAHTGQFIDVFVPVVDGGPRGIVFAPGPR